MSPPVPPVVTVCQKAQKSDQGRCKVQKSDQGRCRLANRRRRVGSPRSATWQPAGRPGVMAASPTSQEHRGRAAVRPTAGKGQLAALRLAPALTTCVFVQVTALPCCISCTATNHELTTAAARVAILLDGGPCNPMPSECYPLNVMGRSAYRKRFVILLPEDLHRQIVEEAARRRLAPSTWARVSLSALVGEGQESNGAASD